ncbi:Uncharacterised protein [uncultured archaeon]|nr:Uncharacterised protein [uncultured archaeon]
MPSGTGAFAQKTARREAEEAQLPLVSLVTYEPVGNPLLKASEAQRRHFFDSLQRRVAPKMQENKGENAHSQVMVEKPSTSQPGSPRVSSPLYQAVYWSALPAFRKAQEGLAVVINEYAGGDEARAREAVDDLEWSLGAQQFRADDLMAVLLLAIEDRVHKADVPAERAQQLRVQGQQLVPALIRQEARQSAQMRLASVREMLRYYFEKSPQGYHQALCKVLGVDESLPEGSEEFQDSLAGKIALVGSFALAELILAEIKARNSMGTQECLLRLGYKYDGKLKRLILGKRTCGNRAEARGILRILLENFRGKRMAEKDVKPPSARMLSVRPRKPAAPG